MFQNSSTATLPQYPLSTSQIANNIPTYRTIHAASQPTRWHLTNQGIISIWSNTAPRSPATSMEQGERNILQQPRVTNKANQSTNKETTNVSSPIFHHGNNGDKSATRQHTPELTGSILAMRQHKTHGRYATRK